MIAGFAGGLGAGAANSRADEPKEIAGMLMTSPKRDVPFLATFAMALLALVAYLVVAVGGWIDWAAGLPAAVLALFIAWTSAIRINERTCSTSR
jgi:hypothetical protein